MSLAAVIGVWAMTAIASERAKSVYDQLKGDPDGRLAKTPGSDLNIVTPDIRDEVIMYLRRSASGADEDTGIKTDFGPDGHAKRLLIRLGDEQKIEEYLKIHEDAASRFGGIPRAWIDYSGEVAHPLLIPRLAKYFFVDDGNSVWDGRIDDVGNMVYPASIGSAVCTLAIIRNSPAFNSALQKWADNAYQRVIHAEYKKLGFRLPDHLIPFPRAADIDLAELRKAMRAWWKENARYFEAKDYASVKPGAWLPAAKVPAAAGTTKDTTQPTAAKTETPSPGPQTGEPAPIASSASPFLYPAVIGLSALLLAALAFLLRRRQT